MTLVENEDKDDDTDASPPPLDTHTRRNKNIETIHFPKKSKSKKTTNHNPLQFKEVQEAMNAMNNNMNSNHNHQTTFQNAISSPDLLSKLSSNPKILSKLSNPKYIAALESLQRNPKQTMDKLRNDGEGHGHHEDILEFIQDICTIMGNHFVELGEEQDRKKNGKKDGNNKETSMMMTTKKIIEVVESKSKAKSSNSSQSKKTPKQKQNQQPENQQPIPIGPLASEAIQRNEQRISRGESSLLHDTSSMTSNEQSKLDSILQDTELTSILMDVEIQRIIQECSTIPGKMRYYMCHDIYGPKLRKMIHAGLLQVA